MGNSIKFILIWAASALWISPLQAATLPPSEHVEAELISEVLSVRPNQPFTVGVRLTMAPEWHIYWKNAGDSGLPTQIEWKLPEGVSAGPIEWPIPKRIELFPLVNFGYEDEAIFLASLTYTPPAGAIAPTLDINAHVRWLECKEICIPAEADVMLSLPVKDEPPAPNTELLPLFTRAHARMPYRVFKGGANIFEDEKTLEIILFGSPLFLKDVNTLTFFPEDYGWIENAAPQIFRRLPNDRLLLTVKKPSETRSNPADFLRGVLVYTLKVPSEHRSEEALEINQAVAPLSSDAPMAKLISDIKNSPAHSTGVSSAPSRLGLLAAVLFSFLGGLLLNLMPCVLPVLSIKILGFVRQAGEDVNKVRTHGLVFSAGVIASFWALALALLLFRSGGSAFGWGFQLQSPYFVFGMVSLFFLLALNLFGVLEIGNSLAGLGGSLGRPAGIGGTFLSGVLATVVATPCTAPFMGAALGFALQQPAAVSLLIFSALGLGMAFPYLVLSGNPKLLRFVPKPGPWMVTLKQAMGFPMLATAGWLLWVLSLQAGAGVVVKILAALFGMGLGAWVLGKWARPEKSDSVRIRARLIGALFLLAGLAFGFYAIGTSGEPVSAAHKETSDGLNWETFSPARLSELRAEGRIVFIDFTAAWCLTCQVNERIALATPAVREKFRALSVALLKADWTRRDETITEALAGYGRNGVPLYVLYGAHASEPVILPELITSATVLKALEQVRENA